MAPIQSDLFGHVSGDTPITLPDGVGLWRGALDPVEQVRLLDDVSVILERAPPYRPSMRNGQALINHMTNCGPLGWYSDRQGYRYIDHHPLTNAPWPPIPARLRALSDRLTREVGITGYDPDACLVNLYAPGGRLGLHQDYDEVDFTWPIVSVSLGASCRFILGGMTRKDPTVRLTLQSGDVMCLYGPSRRRFHGVATVMANTNPISHPAFAGCARINLTLRRAR